MLPGSREQDELRPEIAKNRRAPFAKFSYARARDRKTTAMHGMSTHAIFRYELQWCRKTLFLMFGRRHKVQAFPYTRHPRESGRLPAHVVTKACTGEHPERCYVVFHRDVYSEVPGKHAYLLPSHSGAYTGTPTARNRVPPEYIANYTQSVHPGTPRVCTQVPPEHVPVFPQSMYPGTPKES